MVLFGERTAENLVAQIQPEIYVKGGDYTVDKIPEAKIVQSYGGRVELVDFVSGYSTTATIEKLSAAPEINHR